MDTTTFSFPMRHRVIVNFPPFERGFVADRYREEGTKLYCVQCDSGGRMYHISENQLIAESAAQPVHQADVGQSAGVESKVA